MPVSSNHGARRIAPDIHQDQESGDGNEDTGLLRQLRVLARTVFSLSKEYKKYRHSESDLSSRDP